MDEVNGSGTKWSGGITRRVFLDRHDSISASSIDLRSPTRMPRNMDVKHQVDVDANGGEEATFQGHLS